MATTKKPTKIGRSAAKVNARKSSAKKRSIKKASAVAFGDDTIRIRMYRVGFGDCFLVSLPVAKGNESDDTHRHILVDCGVHARGNIGTMARVVKNIAEVTGRKLAVVIATHAHQDHISGFDAFGDEFSKFDISEVWLPWTQNSKDAQAAKLMKKQVALADQLDQHFTALAASGAPADPASGQIREAAMNAVTNLRGNQHALLLLRTGFGVNARVRYLEAGKSLTNPAKIPGLSVRVLGPPRSEEFLAQMDPPASQHYLRLDDGGNVEIANKLKPFTEKWLFAPTQNDSTYLTLDAEEEKQLKDLANAPLEALAFALDQARNNESLVTLLIYRGEYLLFPGDAQYGNWRWWLENEEPDSILPRVSFFKISHHGSVNATPKQALEQMSDKKFAAMVSTQSSPWPSIPREGLIERLSEKATGVVQSSSLPVPGAPAGPPMAKLPAGFSKGDLWYDYIIKV